MDSKLTKKVFLNDGLIDADKAAISVADVGFLYGVGLFETMRACNGVVFGLNDHIDRLFFSAAKLSVNNTYSRQFIADAVNKLLKANKLTDARIRLTLTSGPVPQGEQPSAPTLLITAEKFTPYPAEYYEKGVMVVLCPYRQNTADPLCGHKTTSYFPRMLALQFAHTKKAAEALWFTGDNHLAEGCVSNVFLVKDSTVYTPPVETPVLAGVARKTVCRLAMENSIKLLEKNLNIDDCLQADEVFLTNVISGVRWVMSYKKKRFYNKFSKMLVSELNKLVL